MAIKRMVLACLLVGGLTGMRDPFQPPPDRCLASQLTQWRYQGIVAMNGPATGIVRNPVGKWQRVHAGDVLPGGWRVAGFDNDEMHIAVGEGCTPPHWRWKREGSQNEKNNSDSRLSQQHAGERFPIGPGDAGGR